MASIPSGTVTFLFTDVEGSTKLAREHPDAWETALKRLHAILRAAIEANNGFVFQIIGDGFCVSFQKAGDALKGAIAIQQALLNEPWGGIPVRVRMGIHTGEAEVQSNEYHAYLTLSLVKRLMSAAHGGQMLVSGTTESLLRGLLSQGIELMDLGSHNFKDFPQAVRIFQVAAPELPNEFPPLRTLEILPNNLPTQLTSFIGREAALGDVKRLLGGNRMLTLIGPGGTGKTRLSIQVANQLLDQYPDGVWLVQLAPILDPELVPRATAMAIGLREEPLRPVIDMLCDYLRKKKMLILLDNCEHLVDACAQMADTILRVAPNAHLLASSREALGITGEVTYRVPSLGLPKMGDIPTVDSFGQYEALQLFIDRATAVLPGFLVTNENTASLVEICQRLDGIPLAIELAAAKVRVLNLGEIARRLDDRFRLLTGGSRTALERHQTLQATVDWSYILLSPEEQTLFQRLSVFVGGWTLDAAESVCSDEQSKGKVLIEDVLSLLEGLINKSLVIREQSEIGSRYRLLETMQQYASEKLLDTNEGELLRDKHLTYFLELAEMAAPHLLRSEQLEWLTRLDADYENLRAALEWALSEDSPERSLRMCAALGCFWDIRTYWLEGSRWLKRALSKPSQSPSAAEHTARVRALYQDSLLAFRIDDLERQRSSAELSFFQAEKDADALDLAIARFFVGLALSRFNDFDKARSLMQTSVEETKALDDPFWESFSFLYLVRVLHNQGEINIGEFHLQAVELARKAGERSNLGVALWSYGDWLYECNQIEDAWRCAEELNSLAEQFGSRANPAAMAFGRITHLHGDLQTAESYLLDMRDRYELLGERNTKAGIAAHLGRLAMEQGDLKQAQVYFVESLTTARELQDYNNLAIYLADMGNVYYLNGQVGEHKLCLREAISIVKSLIGRTKMFFLLGVLVTMHIEEPVIAAHVLGALRDYGNLSKQPIPPLERRNYDRVKAHISETLGEAAFESAFAEGQRMSLDEVLDLVLKTVDSI